ncbi:MAG TPA: FAD-binding oxidoreductase [Solirubrobacteraceae bacterium]|nr:FAD-binding oxidoreductase [Solirubrobacteraceae bacterium]
MSTTTTVADAARQELRSFDGELIGPADAGYEGARAVFNAMIDRRPGLIARCASAEAVADAIAFARRHELPLAVRGGGHNGGGLGTCDDGVVVDLSPLDAIAVDPAARTVTVGGGATWGRVDAATHEHGLAVPSGIISTTGVGGLTLGGGIGHLSRRFGLTVDSLLAADVVLADGTRVRADADEHPDLLWALRGGGGNFGVVTSFRFRAHPVSTVIAGPTFWPIEQAEEVMRWYRGFLPAQPRELNGFLALMTIPPAEFLPAELHLRRVCAVIWCYAGDDEAAATELLEPATAVGTPLLHHPAPVPLPALQSLFDPVYPPGHQWYWRADFVRELPDAAIARHVEHAERLPTPQSTMHLYPIDGAVHDVGPAETAFAHRGVTWAEVIVGVDPDPANAALVRDWTVAYWEATHPHSADGSAYVNFMMDEGEARVRASYGDNYARLARVKRAYDPDNALRVNQNIRPAERF